MQAYFEPEQPFSISMPQPVFEISIACKKKKNMSRLNGRKSVPMSLNKPKRI